MSTITRMETTNRMSRIVIHNNTVFLCGQVAENREEGIVHQTQTMLAKVDALLDQAGSSREHLKWNKIKQHCQGFISPG